MSGEGGGGEVGGVAHYQRTVRQEKHKKALAQATNHQRKSCYIISVVLVTMVALVTKVALVNQVFGSITLSVTLP